MPAQGPVTAARPASPRRASPGRVPLLPHVAAVLVATVVFALVYPPFSVGAITFLATAPVALVFLDPRVPCGNARAALSGLAFGLLAAMAIVGPWMTHAAIDYFERSAAWSLAFTLAVNATHVALFYAPAFLALRLLAPAGAAVRVLGGASAWIAMEAIRANLPAGNAWALLGQGLFDVPLLREAAAWGGAWTMGWAAAACGMAIGVALQPGSSRREVRACAAAALAAPLLLCLLGLAARRDDSPPSSLPPLRIAMVQAGVPARDVWDPSRRVDVWNDYVGRTEAIGPGSVDLVVWPENAAPFLLDADVASRKRLRDLAKSLGAALLLGAPRSEADGQGRAAMHNSAWWFPADGGEPGTYDKRRLLPFVESMPSVLGDLPPAERYAPGTGLRLFDVQGWKVAPLLCFEAVYPDLAREAVLAGADLLVNISNDAWFSAGAGPEQHFAMSVLRAAEFRRPMVRVANGGVSAVVDRDGGILGGVVPREGGVEVRVVEAAPPIVTASAAVGDAVAVAASLACLACLAWSRRRAAATSS